MVCTAIGTTDDCGVYQETTAALLNVVGISHENFHTEIFSLLFWKRKNQKHKHSQAAAGPAKVVTAACMEAPYGQPGIRGTKPAAQTSSWSDVSWWLPLAALRSVSADILWRPPDTYLLLSNIPLRSLHWFGGSTICCKVWCLMEAIWTQSSITSVCGMSCTQSVSIYNHKIYVAMDCSINDNLKPVWPQDCYTLSD